MINNDNSKNLQQAVQEARAQQQALLIEGSGSKAFYGNTPAATENSRVLSTGEHQGIINYEPKELVITARSGTPLHELQAVLAEQQQMLAFEPPLFSSGSQQASGDQQASGNQQATLGGTIACGFSGPRRPYAGSARDFVLGSRIINGEAEILHFGGEVMKNVAGYDVSRLMVGALGTLGVLLDISLKVLPLPEAEQTQVLECSVQEAISRMNQWAGSPLSLSAACYDGALLYIRLSGAPSAVTSGARHIGGDSLDDSQSFWQSIRELQHGFFKNDKPLWRLAVPADTPAIELPGKQLIDWGGAQRWYIADSESVNHQESLYKTIADIGGHVTLFKGDTNAGVFHPLPESLLAIHRRLKQGFDPQGIFNPGRMYREL